MAIVSHDHRCLNLADVFLISERDRLFFKHSVRYAAEKKQKLSKIEAMALLFPTNHFKIDIPLLTLGSKLP